MMNEAYEKLVSSGRLNEVQAQICNVINHCRFMYPGGMSAREIDMWLKSEWKRGHSGAHSRLRELEDILMVVKDGKKTCTVTKRQVNNWRLK